MTAETLIEAVRGGRTSEIRRAFRDSQPEAVLTALLRISGAWLESRQKVRAVCELAQEDASFRKTLESAVYGMRDEGRVAKGDA